MRPAGEHLSSSAGTESLDNRALRTVFHSLPATAVLVLAPDPPRFTILEVTQEYLAATLKTRAGLIGHGGAAAAVPLVFDALTDANPVNPTPTGVDKLRASLDRVLATGAEDRMPITRYDIVREDGVHWEERYWEPRNVPVFGEDGRITAVVHHVRDVTAQVSSNRAAEAAEQRARSSLERMADGYTLLSRDFCILAVNAAAEKVVGRPRDELVGRLHWDVFPASFDSDVGRAYRRVVDEKIELHFTHRYIGEGLDRHIEVDAYPTDDGGVAAFWRDVTDHVRAEQALRDSEARFRTIANAMPQMLWSTLPDGYHEYFNERWYQFTGVPQHSTDADGWARVFHPDDQPRAWERWRHSLRTGEPYEIEYRLRHHSGEYRWVLGRALPVTDDRGKVLRWLGTCTDVHEQKGITEELASQNRRKDEFLAMLAHELRNPLAPIATAAHLLSVHVGDPKLVRRSADIIARQSRHLKQLLDDLLDVSRVTRGLVELHKLPVDLKVVLAHSVEQCRSLIESRGHQLAMRNDPGEAVVLGDHSRLVQIVTNLLTNAARYTPHGGDVRLTLQLEDRTAHVAVADSGIGIEAELIPHVFELFVQGRRTPDRSQGGLGLGLALVKNLVELHGGTITVNSGGLHRGSTFHMRLPLHAGSGGTPCGSTNPARISTPALNLLLVDDNADAVDTLHLLLSEEGHRVQAVTDVDAALELAARERFDVFVLDIGLPKMDGYELARRIRAHPHAARATFIALSGYGQETDKQASRQAGFDHHLVKPVDIAALAAVLGAAAEKQ